ncbi:MAG: DEAD/DEAH box helicase, partial [Pseudomonadota bacterium]|nr:DEAD/DEAH box helicase [Pseudomonadota bacterium]
MPFPPIDPVLADALTAQDYREPTPVQAAVLDGAARGRDLLVSAQTGSGKTVAYGLAMAGAILGDGGRAGRAGPPAALVVAPTRELALQVANELAWLYARAGARLATCVGGMDSRGEQRALASGAHIVVGTPGRLRDHLERGHLDLAAIAAVVIDEADEMLDLGFKEDLEFILEATPDGRRTLLFSATIPKDIAALARRYQRDAVRIDTTARDEPHGDIEYRAMRVAPNEIEHAVVNVLRFFEARGALVFCATREAVRHLNGALRERGFDTVALSGEMTQRERIEALQSLRDGRARVCVATDVAARGLDLPDLGLVIHADLPANRAGLLHRSGRTGRAGRKGISVLLVPYTRRRRAEQILASAGVTAAWSGAPSAEAIRAGDQERLLTDPMLTEPPAEEDLALGRLLLDKAGPEVIAAALIRQHRARLPAPEELFDPGEARGGREAREPRAPRQDFAAASGAVWFRLAVGRASNADPKWLLPMICRRGHVTKKDIGQIRVFDRETKFEIAAEAAGRAPGVTTERDEGEGKFVQVRGTEPSLTNVTVDGAHIPGT